jgi:hypothetical protein
VSQNGNTLWRLFSEPTDILVLLIGIVVFTTQARAAEWTERPYDPPVGSRWVIAAKQSNESDTAGRKRATPRRHRNWPSSRNWPTDFVSLM